MLTKLEDQILLAVLKLKDKAYGISVYQHLEKITGRFLVYSQFMKVYVIFLNIVS